MVQRAIDMMRQLLDGSYDPLQFSLDMEALLCDGYDEMDAEHPELTTFLNEDLPEICAGYERGADPSELIRQVGEQLAQAENYL